MPHAPSLHPDPYRPPTREQIERARAMYGELHGVAHPRRLRRGPQAGPATDHSAAGESLAGPITDQSAVGSGHTTLYPPLPRRRRVLGKRRKPLSGDCVSRTAERQARDLEERLARPAGSSPERERDLRMFGAVVRALRDLSAFDPAAGEGGKPATIPIRFRRTSMNSARAGAAYPRARRRRGGAQGGGGGSGAGKETVRPRASGDSVLLAK